MSRDMVKEPTVMGDDYGTSGEVFQTFLQRTDCVYIHVIGWLVEKKDVTIILEYQGKMQTVSPTT